MEQAVAERASDDDERGVAAVVDDGLPVADVADGLEGLHGLDRQIRRISLEDGAADHHDVHYSDLLRAQKALRSKRWRDAHLLGDEASRVRRRSSGLSSIADSSRHSKEERVDVMEHSPHVPATAQRSTNEKNAIQWEEAAYEMEFMDEEGHFAHGHDSAVPFYVAPVQRQRWGEDQVLPHINWSDLFFDLFYVAMAYNLGNLTKSALNYEHWVRGIIYFLGTFGPLWITWEVSMFHEARYTNPDYFHRCVEVFRFIFVGMAIVFIKPVDKMMDSKANNTFLFILCIFIELVVHLLLMTELYFKGLGDQKAIKNFTLSQIKRQHVPTLLMYLAALIAASVLHFQSDVKDGNQDEYNKGVSSEEDEEVRRLASESDAAYESGYGKYESAEAPLWKLSDLPLTLMAIAYFVRIAISTWRRMKATGGDRGNLRDIYVPENVDYAIHRYGEWVMLMLGEGILSLCIVETVEDMTYYIVTVLGIITMIFISILKYETEPAHSDEHAMWRNLRNSMCYGYLIQTLSISLIAFGVSYKIFLYNIVKALALQKKESAGYSGHAYNEEGSGKGHRILAGDVKVSDSLAAHLFAVFLFFVLLSLELMDLTHGGLKKKAEYLVRRPDGKAARPRWSIIVITLFKTGITIFALTMGFWTEDPVLLTILACLIVLRMALSRVLAFIANTKEKRLDALMQKARETPRVTRAPLVGGSVHSAGKEESTVPAAMHKTK